VDQTQPWDKETEMPLKIIGMVPTCTSIFILTIGERETLVLPKT